MLEEIRQQPDALDRTLRGELPGAEQLRKSFRERRPRTIVLAARGTSDNAARFGQYLLEIMTGIPTSLAAPSISTLYRASIDYKDALVVAISQSGESTDTNVVLEQARKSGVPTIGITNEAGSSLARLAGHVFHVRAGKERSVAATKTYTGQLMSLYMLAYSLGANIDLDDLRLATQRVVQRGLAVVAADAFPVAPVALEGSGRRVGSGHDVGADGEGAGMVHHGLRHGGRRCGARAGRGSRRVGGRGTRGGQHGRDHNRRHDERVLEQAHD